MDIHPAYAHAMMWRTKPFVWGESDCMLVLIDYLIALGYPDCAADERGTYDSALSCQRVTGFLTDPVKPIETCINRIGLMRTSDPQKGDIGVIKIQDADHKIKAVGALFLGKNWAMKGEGQVIIGPAVDVLAAWMVTPCAD